MTDTSQAPARLADELAQAEKDAIGPRQQAAALQARLTAAVSSAQYDEAARIKVELETAREAAAITDARASALRNAAAQLERDRNATDRKLAAAQEHEAAEHAVLAAQTDAAEAAGRMNGELAAMRKSIDEARRHLRAAHSHQRDITGARAREITARGRRGDWPATHPGPSPVRANAVTVLIDRDPVVQALAAGMSR
jgi:hypothetical protein